MAEWDWQPYLTGGGTRPDAMSGLDAQFEMSLEAMFQDAPQEVRDGLRIGSAYRSEQTQKALWDAAVQKYGSPEAARKWVAPPGRSKHNAGLAADLKYLDPAAREWVQENAARYGLAFPMEHEPWHIEAAWARGGEKPPPAPNPLMTQMAENALPVPTFQYQTNLLNPADFMYKRRNALA